MVRSYWIPGSYASLLSKKCNVFLSPLKNKGFKEEIVTKIGLYDLVTSTTLESNKSLAEFQSEYSQYWEYVEDTSAGTGEDTQTDPSVSG